MTLPELCAELRSSTSVRAVEIVGAILSLVFEEPRQDPSQPLTLEQRIALSALVESPQAWKLGDREFGYIPLMLGDFGLPRDRESLAALLAGERNRDA
jgi:hypothetical protein